jgi:hypothetical protein
MNADKIIMKTHLAGVKKHYPGGEPAALANASGSAPIGGSIPVLRMGRNWTPPV